ncbi:MAG: hypothetical protein WBN96_02080, partial [Gammaproteobacteria bacterium]
ALIIAWAPCSVKKPGFGGASHLGAQMSPTAGREQPFRKTRVFDRNACYPTLFCGKYLLDF